jgi:heptosyltransferase-2
MKKILVIRLSSLGDVVLCTSALDFLRQQLPSAELVFLTKPPYAALLQGHPSLSAAWGMDTRGAYAGLSGSLKMARRIRAEGFDGLLDLHANTRSRFLSFFSGAPRRSVVKNYALNRRLRSWFPGMSLTQPPDVSRRAVEAAAGLLRLSAPEKSGPSTLQVSAEAAAWANDFFEAQGLKPGQRLIGIAPGAAWATKRWSPGYFAQAVGLLADSDKVRFIFVGDAKDEALSREILSYARKGAEQSMLAAGATDLPRLAALIARCEVFLTNDSGPMHVASALGVPVVALFGPTVEAFGFFPRGPKDRVLQKDLNCRPCSVHGGDLCPIATHECMQGLAPFDVAQAVQQALSA